MANGTGMEKAVGGNVWVIPPPAEIPNIVIGSGPPCGCRNWAVHYFRCTITVMAFILLPALCIGAVIIGTANAMLSKDDILAGYKEEYGYTRVSVDDDSAKVTTIAGEEKTVGVMTYKGVPVLYETPEQAYERMQKIDAGTYPEQLMEDYKG